MAGIIFISVTAGILAWSSADTSCARDRLGNYWFGPSCRFQCHCFDRRQCDITTGRCFSFGCDEGYFGPGCQYFSIAYKQQTQSSTSSTAVDGYTSTYSFTQSTLNPTWSVEFQHPAWIVWVDVLVPAKFGTRAIAMTTTNINTTMPCDATNAWITTTTLRMTCRNVVNATSITLVGTNTTESRLGLTEVYVYGGRNIALRGDTSQSSVYDIYNSSLAVDAGMSTRFQDRSCTHTAITTDPNWLVRLGQDYQIYRVDVYNRGTGGERLNNFRIRLGKAGISGLKQVYQDTAGTAAEVTSVQMPASRTADRLEVTLRGDSKILTLCEVQVFGDCLDYKYGLACNFTCSCRDRAEVCNKVDGSCLSGCADGFTGVDCKQECPGGRYGLNCSNNCSSNCVDGHCLHVDGTCKCVPGWMGDRCTMDCPDYKYGSACNFTCSCRDRAEVCNKVDGSCLSGCADGFTGVDCKQECPVGSYGMNCSNSCSSNCVNGRCFHVDGTCTCLPGWMGDKCTKDDSNADALQPSINPVLAGLVGSGITAVIAVLVVVAVFLAQRHRRKTQRTPEQVIYHDIVDDANAQNTGRLESQSEPRGVYDVLDVTSRDPDEGLDKPYTELTATRPPREGESRGHYDILDVTTRDQDESLDKPYTELTTKMLYQNIPRTGREDPL
ncbi:uncharacterized protein LOC124133220 isoform X1 [Haliotis rufescens]|uniref:uncharacterized protein LOC124133220 isoform X1 n=1 Tax=Haliotis rufescens TaxID=6454 RepID=UPI00201E7B12|nr:uncharacterized protein LOC124133220 isoform X1 [Haliotis rufescens]